MLEADDLSLLSHTARSAAPSSSQACDRRFRLRQLTLGSRTFGKGLIQTLIGLGDGSGLTVTVARYVTPSGRDIQSLGIAPDQTLAEPEPLNPGGEDDTWLAEAAARLAGELA